MLWKSRKPFATLWAKKMGNPIKNKRFAPPFIRALLFYALSSKRVVVFGVLVFGVLVFGQDPKKKGISSPTPETQSKTDTTLADSTSKLAGHESTTDPVQADSSKNLAQPQTGQSALNRRKNRQADSLKNVKIQATLDTISRYMRALTKPGGTDRR